MDQCIKDAETILRTAGWITIAPLQPRRRSRFPGGWLRTDRRTVPGFAAGVASGMALGGAMAAVVAPMAGLCVLATALAIAALARQAGRELAWMELAANDRRRMEENRQMPFRCADEHQRLRRERLRLERRPPPTA